MAETTRTTSGTPSQTTSSSGSPGGSRNTNNPSSTTTNPSSTTANSPAATSTTASTSSTGGARASSAKGQQTQGQRKDDKDERREDEYHVELSGNAISDARKVGSELVGAARESAVSLIDAQRGRTADQIVGISDALRRSVESLETSGAGSLVQYINQAADQVSGFADTVRERSWSDLAGDLENFARRSPTLFMVSAMTIGFFAGRFLLSSSERTATPVASGTGAPSVRANEMRRDSGSAGRTISPGVRAEYGSGSPRE